MERREKWRRERKKKMKERIKEKVIGKAEITKGNEKKMKGKEENRER